MSSRCGTSVQQNDPSEPLEVFDAAGRPTGRAKSRAAIHLDGDWHQAFHCWIVRQPPGGAAEIVLQRRALSKDTFPGRWDAAAAGHWRFGETPEQAAREVAEELGLAVDFARLRYVGRERLSRHFPNGLIDREHHQVYRLECDRPLATYRPSPVEVIGVAAFAARALLALAARRRERVMATEAVSVDPDGQLRPEQVEIGREDIVPYSSARLRRLLQFEGHG